MSSTSKRLQILMVELVRIAQQCDMKLNNGKTKVMIVSKQNGARLKKLTIFIEGKNRTGPEIQVPRKLDN